MLVLGFGVLGRILSLDWVFIKIKEEERIDYISVRERVVKLVWFGSSKLISGYCECGGFFEFWEVLFFVFYG